MKNLLLPRHRGRVARGLSARTLLAFDFDGSLAPIHQRRDRAALRSSTRQLLNRLIALYPCVVISTRGRQDLLNRLEGIAFREVFGNHGIEPTVPTDRFRRHVQRWQPVLTRLLARCPGMDIEDKAFSVSIHYRRSLHKRASVAAIRTAAAALGSVRLIQGRQVIHLLPSEAPDKGTALQKIRRRLLCEAALYVGDDESDEAVFGLPGEWLVSVRIGAARHSRASYFIPRQCDIDRLLDWLISLRRGGTVTPRAVDEETRGNHSRRSAAERRSH